MKSFNVVIASKGRPSLINMVESIAPQLSANDYLTVIWDSEPFELPIGPDVKYLSIQNKEPLGAWGHGSRNKWGLYLPGDYILNGDDDDVYLPDAMEHIRSVCTEQKLYVFRMNRGELVLPRYPEIEHGNIGTPCLVYPTMDEYPEWVNRYGGDLDFATEMSKRLPVEFSEHVIYEVVHVTNVGEEGDGW